MPQFDVYKNPNAATRARFPLLLDIQCDLLEPLATRVVVPLSAATANRTRSLSVLTPTLRVDGREYVAVVPQLAGIAMRELGTPVGNLREQRDAIVAAVDLLVTGI
jgi:toxin CcdB